MKAYPNITLFIPLLLITIHALKDENIIESTCRTSSQNDPNIDFGFCTTALQSSPASQSHTTLEDLGAISITLVINNLTDTRSYIEHLLKDDERWRVDPLFRQCLDDCLDLYSDGIDEAEEAMDYYGATEFENANVAVSSIMDGVVTCEDGFKERKGLVSPLSKRNSDVFSLLALALSVMHMVQTR